ncbi:expressed unknown protein [Seminavis robusta]|uniref:Uncharacterized protein n=1 Tax=Seminavis robusta TaxID=568900 RepID=A0A9N8EE77_9STRA|nr:expressed unknown protein [Seminavis robusta]|eukprot:Sro1050_g235561.1  (114) ;mRNA; r:27035-27376
MVDSDDESGPQDDHGANENDAEETKAEESEEGIPFGPDNPGPFFPEQITPRNFVTCIQEAIPMTPWTTYGNVIPPLIKSLVFDAESSSLARKYKVWHQNFFNMRRITRLIHRR